MADVYHQVVQKRGQPLREGFTVAKVRAARVSRPAIRRSRKIFTEIDISSFSNLRLT